MEFKPNTLARIGFSTPKNHYNRDAQTNLWGSRKRFSKTERAKHYARVPRMIHVTYTQFLVVITSLFKLFMWHNTLVQIMIIETYYHVT